MNRFIYSDNGSLSDWSLEVSRFDSSVKTFTFNASEDAFYIGSLIPFNNFYFELGTANTNSITVSIATWDGSLFRDAEDVIDQTVGLTTSGIIQFTPDRDHVWAKENTNYGGASVTGLTSLRIYDHYWAKITLSGATTASSLKYFGHKFCDDTDLGAEYPMLNRQVVRNAFSSGLTNFNEQTIRASDYVIQDIKKAGIIWHKGQILEASQLKLATVHKAAEIIFNALGDDYNDQRDDARVNYKKNLDIKGLTIDLNENGIAEEPERLVRSGWLYR